jgi:hypothetical protein
VRSPALLAAINYRQVAHKLGCLVLTTDAYWRPLLVTAHALDHVRHVESPRDVQFLFSPSYTPAVLAP